MTDKPNATRSRKLTPKQRVLRKHPEAICYPSYLKSVGFVVKPWDGLIDAIGEGKSPRSAWADAARNI